MTTERPYVGWRYWLRAFAFFLVTLVVLVVGGFAGAVLLTPWFSEPEPPPFQVAQNTAVLGATLGALVGLAQMPVGLFWTAHRNNSRARTILLLADITGCSIGAAVGGAVARHFTWSWGGESEGSVEGFLVGCVVGVVIGGATATLALQRPAGWRTIGLWAVGLAAAVVMIVLFNTFQPLRQIQRL